MRCGLGNWTHSFLLALAQRCRCITFFPDFRRNRTSTAKNLAAARCCCSNYLYHRKYRRAPYYINKAAVPEKITYNPSDTTYMRTQKETSSTAVVHATQPSLSPNIHKRLDLFVRGAHEICMATDRRREKLIGVRGRAVADFHIQCNQTEQCCCTTYSALDHHRVQLKMS